MKLCSACLLGINCKWDGTNNKNKRAIAMKEHLIPVCPEQLGGLSTPREPAQIIGKRVFTASGTDVTSFLRKALLKPLRLQNFTR